MFDRPLQHFKVRIIRIFINFSNCKSRREKSFVSNECIKKIKCMFNNKQNFLHCRDRMVSFLSFEKLSFWKSAFQVAESRALDSIGGGHLLRSLDSIGGANLLRGLDSIGGAHLLRQVDSIGGGNLLRSVDHVPRYHKRGYDPLRYYINLNLW